MRHIDTIVIHCAATPPEMDIGAAEIRGWHLSRGWDDIGYHYVIRRDGSVEHGRPDSRVGAHAQGHNEASIGVCWVGGVNEDREPEDNRTPEQKATLEGLVLDLLHAYTHIPTDGIIGHRETGARKACPSFDVQELRDAVRSSMATNPKPRATPISRITIMSDGTHTVEPA